MPPQGYGGVPVNALARGLHDRGHDVTVITGSTDLSIAWQHTEPGLQIVVVPFRPDKRLRLLTQYRDEIRILEATLTQVDAEVVHAHWTYEFAIAALRVRGDATVTARDLPWEELVIERRPGLAIRYAMAWRVRNRVKRLTANSEYTASGWHRQMLYKSEIPIVPNPVSFPPGVGFAANVGRCNSEHPKRLLCISNAGAAKNVGALLRVWPRIRAVLPDAELHLVGQSLDSDFVSGHLGNGYAGITLHGHLDRTDLFRMIDLSDVLVHPSLQETVGNPILEAMSRGIPIVGNRNCKAVSSLLGDGHRGSLVDFNEPEDVLRGLLNGSRDQLASAALLHCEKKFSLAAVSAQWERLYAKSIAWQ